MCYNARMSTLRLFLVSLLAAAGVCTAQLPEGLLNTGSESPMGGLAAIMGGEQQPGGPELKLSVSASVGSYKQGEAFYIAAEGDITKPWHGYFRNPGTVGEPMTAELKAPEGFAVRGPFWSIPVRHESAFGSVAYAYETPVIIWEVTAQETAPQQATFTISSTAQLCSDEGCAPPTTTTAELSLSSGDGAAAPEWKAEKLDSIIGLKKSPIRELAEQSGNEVRLRFPTGAVPTKAHFFSYDNSISPTAEQKLVGDALVLTRNDNKDPLHPVSDESTVGKPLSKLSGVLVADGRVSEVDIDLVAAALPQPAAAKSVTLSADLLILFLSLFAGGLILNLMPCVFPVIGLKIMSFVELGGGSRRKVFLHSLAFVLGILISFWIIAALLIVFSNLEVLAGQPWTQWASTLWNDVGSESRNWAAWMQNEWIVFLIMLLLLTLGLSMFGVFEIGVGATSAGQGMQSKSGLTGSFFQGLFVTVVATPCSAPFLGTAMPAAMALPGVWMTAALTFMALGLAFPYILLGIFPSLVKYLPTPGAWMESLKQGLSFLLFAATAWILFVYLAFIPADPPTLTLKVLIGLVVFSAAFWVYGRWCPMYQPRKTRIIGLLVALALAATGVYYSMPKSQTAPTDEAAAQVSREWEDWSEARMQELLDEGTPVYVDFTAKWCATCLANKGVAYSDDVYKAFNDAGVVLMRADKTRPNEAIDAAMRKLNRSSVPVNALYLPDGEPVVTRELLTADYLLDFLKANLPAEAPAEDEEIDEEDEEAPEDEESDEEEA